MLCGEIIPKGSRHVRYKNLFTGKRGFYHDYGCPKKVMTAEQKEWIDNASYEELLRKWRFAPAGDPFFRGEAGKYYTKKLAEKKQEVGQEAHVAASKSIGWDK